MFLYTVDSCVMDPVVSIVDDEQALDIYYEAVIAGRKTRTEWTWDGKAANFLVKASWHEGGHYDLSHSLERLIG